MEPERTYRVPSYLRVPSSEGKVLSESDLSEIEQILDISSGFAYPEANTEANWKSFAAQIQPGMQVTKRPTRFAMFRWAAAAVVILTLGLGYWQYREARINTFTATYNASAMPVHHILPDGSRIDLNAGANLEVKAINKHKRILELKSGEIFVRVVHNDIPFRVITDKGIISVMGTEFSVRNTVGKAFLLCLKSGSIQFESAGEKIILKPGQQLEEDANGDFVIRNVRNNLAYAWASGKVSFDNSSLSEIIKGLESVYNVKFEYDAQLSGEKLTITFDNLSAGQAAELLSKTLKSPVKVL